MGDLHGRIAALSPARLELFALRFAQRYGHAVVAPPTPDARIAESGHPDFPQDGDPEELLARVGELPDEHVDVLLRRMLGQPEAPSVQTATTAELLENIGQYSDADVDSLIRELLAARDASGP